MRVTLFDHFTSTHPTFMQVDYVLENIKNCVIQDKIDALRKISDKKDRKAIKENLPCILFAGEFYRRNDSSFHKAAGLCILDFDQVIGDIEEAKNRFKAFPFVYSVFVSPSGDGLKVLVRIPATLDKHRDYYRGLMKLFPDLDSTSQNESRICFSSCDKNIYINPLATEFKGAIEENKRKNVGVIDPIIATYTNYSRAQVALNIIRNAVEGEKHYSILKAGTLMGGLISGGLVEECQGIALLEHEIKSKHTIDDFDHAIKTVHKAIEYGKLDPINDDVVGVKDKQEKPIGIIKIQDCWSVMKDSFVNGKKRGSTTHFPLFDQLFTWKEGELTLVIGIPNTGKTEFTLQLMLIKSFMDGWKWAVFSPENYPADEFFDGLIHTLVGKTTDPYFKDYQMSMQDYESAVKFINKHFFYIYPEGLHSIEEIEERYEWLIEHEGINGTFTDPYNQVFIPDNGKRDDQHLSVFLTARKRFAVKNNLCSVFSSHPKSMQKNKSTGEYDVPDVYDIAGGAMWSNKVDNIICVERPNSVSDPKNTKVIIHTKKIKKQRLVGSLGSTNFDYIRGKNRYYQEGFSPFEKKIEYTQMKIEPNRLVEVKEDEIGECPF